MKKEDLVKLQGILATTNAGWTAEENRFTGMSQAELQNYLGFEPGPNEMSLQEREKRAVQNFQAFTAIPAGARAFGYPTAFDNRNIEGRNYITAIRDQASCGSCVAFGTIATVEGTLRRQLNDPDFAIDLSEAHLFYCHAKGENRNCGNGWWPERAFEHFRVNGVTAESYYPYTAGDQNCNLAAGWNNNLTKITAWRKLDTHAAMKEWLAARGPLEACFTVYQDFFSYSGGVYRHSWGQVVGGHCVSVVGYDDVGGYWIIKNSWGTDRGEGGYFKIAYGQVGIDAEMRAVDGIVENMWLSGKKVQGLWTINEDRNAWAYMEGSGWRKIANNDDDVFANLLAQLVSAKNMNRAVSVYLTDGMITQIYN